MDSLLPLTPLTAHIEHVYAQLPTSELCLADTRRFRSCSQDICFVGYIVRCSYPRHFIEEAILTQSSRISAPEADARLRADGEKLTKKPNPSGRIHYSYPIPRE